MVNFSQFQLDKVQPLDQANFERIKDDEFKPSYDLIGLKYLRDKAGNERNLRELYRGRALYELLQNADDAGAQKAVYILSSEGFGFAHDGEWFTVDNFRSLADGWSDKDPNQFIGHKGLGFRSVLDITPAPHLLKVQAGDFFGIKFAWALNNGQIQETLNRRPELRRHYDGWTKQGQLCCPVMAIPGLAKKRALGAGESIFDAIVRGDYGSSYTTLFWFPAKDPDINSTVLSELSPIPITADEPSRNRLYEFVTEEVSVLLPFLASISDVKVYEGNRCIASAQVPGNAGKAKEGQISISIEAKGKHSSRSFFRMSFNEPIPHQIKNLADTPKAVKRMSKARLSFLVDLEDGKPVYNAKATFHVYFPTKESTSVGFIIHGDFYVEPHRTYLMEGGYNEWLLGRAAKAAASDFLTRLLQRYRPSAVFEALSPTESAASESGGIFKDRFAKALQERTEPFIPTNLGLLAKEEVLLPPSIDVEGFWEQHFTPGLSKLTKKRAFLEPKEDGRRTRSFLSLAKVDVLRPEELIEFVEAISESSRDAQWWYDCYSFMSNDEKLSRNSHSFYAGHKLIPAGKSGVMPVPKTEGSIVVSMPPSGNISELTVPECFSSTFVFIDAGVAELLQSGKDIVRSWVLDRFHISRFEATDLLPRAISRVATQIFTGNLDSEVSQLRDAWKFIKAVTDASRMIKSSDFWNDIGRFPLPLSQTERVETLGSDKMMPAFLGYWPDSWVESNNCLRQVEGLRRIDERFLDGLISENATREQWVIFFSQMGVSKTPKLLRYSRIVPGDELLVEQDGLNQFPTQKFSGLRQSDTNKVAVKAILGEHLWGLTVESFTSCGHGFTIAIQTITVLEGLAECTKKAENEFQSSDPNWEPRLWALVKDLKLEDIRAIDADSAFCRGGRGGHVITAGRYVERQLHTLRWLPTSFGPANGSECFLRFSSRRLISSGTLAEELGDKLLAYVVVDNINDLAKLQGLGIETLDDVDSASIPALISALSVLGEQFSSGWGQQEVMKSPPRWRLVRGAIQEVYRRLNQYQERLKFPPSVKFATRSQEGVQFSTSPLYYADPGSPIERAFMGILPLFDADRAYARLFEQVPVSRLSSSGEGKTVDERLLTEEGSQTLPRLRDEIAMNLSPFLLAPIIARSERQKDIEVVVRRLKQRFEVKACDNLAVSFSLIAEPTMERSIDFGKFYVQRSIVPGESAGEEAHYVLYVADGANGSIAELDADALGQALAPIFFVDRITDELAGLFPRITYKYQQANGNLDEVREFLYYQLGISHEALDSAVAIISGDSTKLDLIQTSPPLPVKFIAQPTVAEQQSGLQQSIDKHQQKINQKLTEILKPFISLKNSKGGPRSPTRKGGGPIMAVSPEQQARGKRGEEEIKRRLKLAGGWAGFVLLEDKRSEDCGYDFLSNMGGRQIELEVKTFTLDGRIFVTANELRAAAEDQDGYYLIGVLDDGTAEVEWCTFIVSNPLQVLLSKGEFDIEAKLQAPAADIFEINKE